MAHVPCLKLTVVAGVVGVMIGLSPAGIEAQSVGERIKRAAEAAAKALEAKNKAKEEQRQKGEQPGPPGTPTGSQGRGRQPNAAPAATTPKPSSAKVESEVVAPVAAREHMFISRRGAHLATAVQRGSRWVVTYDGADGPRFDEIVSNRVRFSPDGTRHLYIGRAGEEYVFMVDGKELTRIPRTNTQLNVGGDDGPADFSPNGKHVYFAIRGTRSGRNEDNYCQLYVNGQPLQKSYGGSSQCKPTWSPDGNRYALIVNPLHTPGPSNSGSPLVLIVDGKPAGYPGPGFSMPHPELKFTADGKHLFAKTMQLTPGRDPTHVMFMDGKPWVKAQDITVHVPPAGDRVVAVISSGQGGTSSYHQFLHVDGRKVPGTECPGYGLVVRFSPDGKRYAAQCQVQGAKGHSLVVDGKKGQEYDFIEHFGFTPDSSKVVYVARMGRQVFVVTGEEESDGYQRVVGPDPAALPVAFGAGGKRIGYAVQTMNSQCGVVVDGKLTLLPPPSCVTEVSFSHDGSRYASFGAPMLIVDGAVQNKSASVFGNRTTSGIGVVFSPDGKYIAHLAGIPSDASRLALVVNDRQMLLPSSTHRPVFMPTFTPDGRHFVFAATAGIGFPLGQELIIYVDGRPAARFPGGAPGFPWVSSRAESLYEHVDLPAWEMGPDGVLTFLVQDGVDANAVMKRVKITPPTDTNIDTMLSEMRPVGGR